MVEVEGVALPPTTTLQALQLSPDDIPAPSHSAQETLYSLPFQSIIPDGCKEFFGPQDPYSDDVFRKKKRLRYLGEKMIIRKRSCQ